MKSENVSLMYVLPSKTIRKIHLKTTEDKHKAGRPPVLWLT